MPTETPAQPPTLWPQATPSPVSGGEGVNLLSRMVEGVHPLARLGGRATVFTVKHFQDYFDAQDSKGYRI
jgi:hypothetical protein